VENPEIVSQVAQCGQRLKQNVWLATTKAFIIILEEHAILSPIISGFLSIPGLVSW
jgi:hypothetical protein